MVVFFFFQAEDGIRDLTVTGVQTCALPISSSRESRPPRPLGFRSPDAGGQRGREQADAAPDGARSEEHTSELQSQSNLVCRLLLEKKKRSISSRSRSRLLSLHGLAKWSGLVIATD